MKFLLILSLGFFSISSAAMAKPTILRLKTFTKHHKLMPTTRLLYGSVGNFQGGQTVASIPKTLK